MITVQQPVTVALMESKASVLIRQLTLLGVSYFQKCSQMILLRSDGDKDDHVRGGDIKQRKEEKLPKEEFH